MPTEAFGAAFAAHARQRPDAPALIHDDQVIDYAGLARMASAAGSALADLRIDRALPLCIPAVKTPATIALLMAAFAEGRRVLLPSATLGGDALTRLCETAGCADVLSIDGGTVTARDSGATGRPSPEPGLLLTTSGSTGTPKIVDLSGTGVDAFLTWASDAFGICGSANVLNYAPLNFDLCLLDVWSALAAGAAVTLVDTDRAADGTYLAKLLDERRPTVVQAVPLFFRLAIETGGTFGSVRDVLLTGDVVPADLLRAIPVAFPNARLWNVYGCTETNDSFLYEIDPTRLPDGPMPIGAPITGVEVAVRTADDEIVTGAGEGELLVRTPFQATGYLGAPPDDPRWPGGWFRSGDLVRRDENGVFFLTGRNDHQVKVRGVRTNLQEVEQVVLNHPEVAEAAVIPFPDERAGTLLRAVIRRKTGSAVNGLSLRLHCAAALPRTAIPSAFELVDDALPRTSTGKIDRTVLRERAA